MTYLQNVWSLSSDTEGLACQVHRHGINLGLSSWFWPWTGSYAYPELGIRQWSISFLTVLASTPKIRWKFLAPERAKRPTPQYKSTKTSVLVPRGATVSITEVHVPPPVSLPLLLTAHASIVTRSLLLCWCQKRKRELPMVPICSYGFWFCHQVYCSNEFSVSTWEPQTERRLVEWKNCSGKNHRLWRKRPRTKHFDPNGGWTQRLFWTVKSLLGIQSILYISMFAPLKKTILLTVVVGFIFISWPLKR